MTMTTNAREHAGQPADSTDSLSSTLYAVEVYRRYDESRRVVFGPDIAEGDENRWAYDGWLPAATATGKDGRTVITRVGDAWLTRPAGLDERPHPDAAPLAIDADAASCEITERALAGMTVFGEPEAAAEAENDLELMRGTRWMLCIEAGDALRKALDEVRNAELTHAAVIQTNQIRVKVGPPDNDGADHADQPGGTAARPYKRIEEFINDHLDVLAGRAAERVRIARAHVRKVIEAATRLGAFDE